jgi:23S rRNA (uracil1939-C5)-methyltransferase
LSCPLAVEPINGLLSDLRNNPSFVRDLRSEMQIVFRFTDHDGALHYKKDSGYSNQQLVESTLFGQIDVPLKSFFQINRNVADRVTGRIIELLKADTPQWAIDLYCGVGVFTLAALNAGVARVAAIDTDALAVKAAEENANKHGFTEGIFRAQSAESGLDNVFKKIEGSTCALILDPPRRGLSLSVIKTISIGAPRQLLYVSCAPDTLSRDIARLGKFGYVVEHAQMFDMFPRTAYFESLTVLKRA